MVTSGGENHPVRQIAPAIWTKEHRDDAHRVKNIQAELQSAQEAGITLPLTEVLNSYLDETMDNGREEPDLFALVDMAREESYTNKIITDR